MAMRASLVRPGRVGRELLRVVFQPQQPKPDLQASFSSNVSQQVPAKELIVPRSRQMDLPQQREFSEIWKA